VNKTFENCHRFTYAGSWFVMDHFRCSSLEPNLWRSERRDRKGNVLKSLYRTDQEMRPLFEKCKDLYECKFYSLSSNTDFSVYSC
jgi:hypothetical protein